MIVYADILLTVNFIITYFLLLTASVISGYTYIRKRIIAASLAGAISCLYIFVQTENLIVNFTVKILSLVICSLIAFGYKNIRKLLISTLYFVMLNTVITGILTAVSLKSKAVYHNKL